MYWNLFKFVVSDFCGIKIKWTKIERIYNDLKNLNFVLTAKNNLNFLKKSIILNFFLNRLNKFKFYCIPKKMN